MAHLRIQHTLQGGSGMPEDRFVNVFHVRSEAVMTEAHLDTVAQSIADFYDLTPSGTAYALAHVYNTAILSTGRSVKIYDMADAMPRHAIKTLDPGASAFDSSGVNLPEELAMCLSYRSTGSSGTPVARTRGRIYLGPFVDSVLATGGTPGQSKPADTVRDIALAAGRDLQQALDAIGYQWCVWSGTGNILHTITEVSVDNAWDIQRRRGHAPTFRTTMDAS